MGNPVLVLHSAYGLTRGVSAVVDSLAASGHDVVAPDYYRGRVFTTESEGIGYRDSMGYDTLLERVRGDIAGLPEDVSMIGFSLGASFAHRLVGERPRTRHLILLGNTNPVREGATWPGIPVQIHRYAEDRWVDPAHVETLRSAVELSGAMFEDHVQPGAGHLFTERHLPEYNPTLVEVTVARIADFLDWA
ncbi:MAG: dienelactone hydrolase family protein [Mobilicoccus sp.]|nr:dienelactone hydrolase family protein [Mobilicoccus sp.]